MLTTFPEGQTMTAVMHHEPTDAELIGAALRTSQANAPSLTTITVPSVDKLQRVLTNALLAAQSETARDNRPPLQCVALYVTDGVVELVTTDSYRMMHQAPAWEVNGPDGHWMIHRDALVGLLALCKSLKAHHRTSPVALKIGAKLIEVRGLVVCDVPLADGWTFPNWRMLVPADEKLTGTAHPVAFNPRFLADMAKYRAPRLKAGEGTVKVRTQDHLKPAMFTLSAEAWYLLMPVRAA